MNLGIQSFARILASSRWLIVTPLVCAALMGCQQTIVPSDPPPAPTPPAGDTVSMPMDTNGGTLEHPSGARLVVPAGALSGSGTVRLQLAKEVDQNSQSVLMPVSKRFVINLEGAKMSDASKMSLQIKPQAMPQDNSSLVFRTQDQDGEIHMRRATIDPSTQTVSLNIGDELNLRDERARTFEVVRVPDFNLAAPPQILAVPYYWQDNLPWCVPTALSMAMNQYENLLGNTANFALAGADKQASDAGNSYVGILNSLKVDKSLYEYIKWDADLIPSAPFTNYMKLYTHGFTPSDYGGTSNTFVQPRAPALSSSTTKHAFVGVGANNEAIWLHDSSGAFVGSASIAKKLSWKEFRDIAIDEDKVTELRSLVFFKNPKPAKLRRGSIVLEEGANASLSYVAQNGTTLSDWNWDGSFWKNGYIWDDPTNTLPQDPIFGNRFKRTAFELLGHFDYKARVANITSVSRSYKLWVFLTKVGTGESLEVHTHDITVPAYSWKNASVTGQLNQFVITQDGKYEIRFELIENASGEFQDTKTIGFYVGDGPLAIP